MKTIEGLLSYPLYKKGICDIGKIRVPLYNSIYNANFATKELSLDWKNFRTGNNCLHDKKKIRYSRFKIV